MRSIARLVGLTLVSLAGLVPIQAQPAGAFVGSLNVEPEKIVRIADSDHRLTATVTPAAAAHIVFEDDDNPVTPPLAECDTDAATGACSVKINEAAGTNLDTIRAYVEDGPPALPCPAPANADADCSEGQDETATPGATGESPPDDTDVVSVEFVEGSLDVTPETPTTAVAPGATVTLTASLKSTETTPRNLVGNVDGEIIPPASPNVNKDPAKADMECTTAPGTGTCALSYVTGPNSGVDTVRGWVDLNDDPQPQPGEPTDPESDGDEQDTASPDFEGDATEGADEATTPGTTDETPPDITDVVTVNISAAQVLSLGPASQTKDVGSTATLTASVTLGGTPQNNIKVAGIVLTGGPNATKTAACTTGSAGTCTLSYLGGSATGADKFRATVDSDGNGQPNEADSTEDIGNNGATAEPDTTAVAQINWVTPTPQPDGGGDDDKCAQARKDLKKAKRALKKAKRSGDAGKIAKAKKRVKRAKKKVAAACS